MSEVFGDFSTTIVFNLHLVLIVTHETVPYDALFLRLDLVKKITIPLYCNYSLVWWSRPLYWRLCQTSRELCNQSPSRSPVIVCKFVFVVYDKIAYESKFSDDNRLLLSRIVLRFVCIHLMK